MHGGQRGRRDLRGQAAARPGRHDLRRQRLYTGAHKREELQDGEAAFWIAEKPSKVRAIRNKRERRAAERWEHFKASLRAKVEHPFRVIKRQFGYTKVRYRGLAKNSAQALTLFALSNLWMARRRLLAPAG